MSPTFEFLLQTIYACVDEINQQFGGNLCSREDQPLLGTPGGLDSLGFVNFISGLEEALVSQFGVQLTLADELSSPERVAAFATLGDLARFLAERLANSQRLSR